jgi:hypothetical protein
MAKQVITDDTGMADELNKFFSKVFMKEDITTNPAVNKTPVRTRIGMRIED